MQKMKNVFMFLIFITLTFLLFFINSLYLLIGLFLLSLIIAVLLKINFKRAFYNFKLLFPFIAFTAIINLFLDGIQSSVMIGIRLIICYNVTYIYSNICTPLEIADAIEKICYPLKIIKVNTKNIGMIVSISICMIPVLREEIVMIMRSMKSRGKVVQINSINVIMKPTLISILKRTSQIEKTLIAKGYMEE